jgi:putative two-component system response regulator
MAEQNGNVRIQTVLIVDDTPDNIALISSALKDRYRVKAATEGEKALGIASLDPPPDLILLDVMMPGMDGYEVCRRLKEDPRTGDIPVIFLTARSHEEDEQRGLELGAVDYISKPISPAILLTRVATHLQLKGVRDFLKDKSDYLEQEVARRTQEVGIVQDATMVALGSLAETRDNETGNHIRRTRHSMKILSLRLREEARFAGALPDAAVELLYKSAPLHDIGKVGIPDRILLKPGKLTPEEFETMKTHTTLGRNAILAAERLIGSSNSFLRVAREIAQTHHERWDGRGYPDGTAGSDIVLPGRLMSVVDVYDALISRRVYKPSFPHDVAVAMIREGAGTQFDPDVVAAFLESADEIKDVAERFADREKHP